MAETAVDLLLSGLLLLTVVWCALVHQRLRRLRADRGEMEAFIGALTLTTDRAEAAIAGLRAVGETTQAQLVRQEEAARRRAEELARAMDAAQRMLRRLETGYQQAMRNAFELERRDPARSGGQRDRAGVQPLMCDHEARTHDGGPGPAQSQDGKPRISEELLRVLQGLR